MALDITSFGPALKNYYSALKVETLAYSENPFLSMVAKDEKFTGDVMKVPLIYGAPQNRSSSFANASAGTSNTVSKAFLVTRKADYAFADISNEVMLASEGNAEAFLSAATVEMDGALSQLGRSVAIKAFRSGSGSVGQIAATSGVTTTISLAQSESVTNFEVGQRLQLSATDGGSAARAGVLTITGIDRSTGVLTVTNGVTGTAAGDFIFPEGDIDAAISGLDAWLPFDNRSARLAASFFGVVRSADATRLGGLVRDYSQGEHLKNVEEALVDAAVLVAREGGSPDVCIVGYQDWANLEQSMGTRVQYTDHKSGAEGTVGFRSLLIQGPKGTIKVIADQNCPSGRFFMLTMKTWKLASLKKAVNLFDGDGLKMIRSSTSDALRIQCFSYANLVCNAPGYNLQGKLR